MRYLVWLFLFIPALLLADVPTNEASLPRSSGGQQLGTGSVQDLSTTVYTLPNVRPLTTGVPNAVWTQQYFDSPAGFDDNYFIDAVATGTGTKTYTLLANQFPTQTDSQTGQVVIIPRCFVLKLSGASTVTLTLTFNDAQHRTQTCTKTFTNASAISATACTGTYLTSVTSVGGSGAVDRNLSIGYGNIFGLNYPCYTPLWALAAYDSGGDAMPNTTMSSNVTWVQGLPNGGTVANQNDRYGTVLLGSSSTTNGTLSPNGTDDYAILYPCTEPNGIVGTGNYAGTRYWRW